MQSTVVQSLPRWHDFYILSGSAAATLIGLLFVALSLSAGLVYSEGAPVVLAAFYTPTFVQFTDVLLLAALCLAPLDSQIILGVLALLLAIVNLSFVVRDFRRQLALYSISELERQHRLWRLLLPVIAYLVLLGGGLGLTFDRRQALVAVASSTLGLLVIGIRNAWQAMVWVTAHKSDAPGQ